MLSAPSPGFREQCLVVLDACRWNRQMTKKVGVRLGRDKQLAPEEFPGAVLCGHAVNRGVPGSCPL